MYCELSGEGVALVTRRVPLHLDKMSASLTLAKWPPLCR